jgi:putative ABC transport system ATP-binding protein
MNPHGPRPPVKGRAFGSPLARDLYPRASTAEVDPRAKPGAPVAVAGLAHVTKTFNGHDHRTTAVRDVSFEAFAGELILLLGPSGSGKTTLLTLIAGLSRPTAGTVSLFGRDIERFSAKELQRLRAEKIGFIFQTFLLIDSLTARENIEAVLRFNGTGRSARRTKATALLRRLQIEYLAGRFPRTMSQGEKQRVAVARAMANDAELIIADEPTGSLETKQGLGIIRILHALAKEGNKCVIVASHDLRLAEFTDRVIRLEDGRMTS